MAVAVECLNCYCDLTILSQSQLISCQNGHSQLCYECMLKWRSECQNHYRVVTCPICRAELAEDQLSKMPVSPNWASATAVEDYTIVSRSSFMIFDEGAFSRRLRSVEIAAAMSTTCDIVLSQGFTRGCTTYYPIGYMETSSEFFNAIPVNTAAEITLPSATQSMITTEINRRDVTTTKKTTKAQLSEQLGLPVVSRRSKKRSRAQG